MARSPGKPVVTPKAAKRAEADSSVSNIPRTSGRTRKPSVKGLAGGSSSVVPVVLAVPVRDLQLLVLAAKYEALCLGIQADDISAGPDGSVVTQLQLDAVRLKFNECLAEFRAAADLRSDKSTVIELYHREDMRLLMAMESKRDFAELAITQETAIRAFEDMHPVMDPELQLELDTLTGALQQTEIKIEFRTVEIDGILRGDGLEPDVQPMGVRAVSRSSAVVPKKGGVLPPVVTSLLPSDGDEDDDDAKSDDVVSGPLFGRAAAAVAVRKNSAANVAAAGNLLGGSSSRPSMFSGYAIASGYDYLFEHKALRVPDPMYPETRYLDRIQVSALQTSMLAPVLVFKDIADADDADWGYLQPLVAAVYAVIADGNDGVTNLMLVYAEKAYTNWHEYPMCLSFQCDRGSSSVSILVYSELAIRTRAIDANILRAMADAGVVNPIAPSTPSSSRSSTTVQLGTSGYAVEKSSGKSSAEWIPLRRALHGDKSKIAFFTKGEPDAKITGNALLLTRIRNQGKGTTKIMSLPVMQAQMLVKLLMMSFCVTIDFVGTGASRVPDALHISMFMESPSQGTFFRFSTSKELVVMFQNMEKVCMTIFQENYGDPSPHFARCFDGIKDDLNDDDPDTGIQHCSINYQVWKVEQIVVEWSNLYSNEDYASMSRGDFLTLNIQTLSIAKDVWRRDHGQYDKARIPVQVLAPPVSGKVAAEEGKGGRYSRPERRAYKAAGDHANQPGQHAKAANPPGAFGGGRGAGGRGGGRGRGAMPVGANKPVVPVVIKQEKVAGGHGVKGASTSICLRDLMHAKDPAVFPDACMTETETGVACRYRHDILLTSGGKLNPADKAAAMAGAKNMQGEFAALARDYLENHM